MKIAVLFDGAGLARLGLEQAGHTCFGVELDPVAHHLGTFVGGANTYLCDVRDTLADHIIGECDAVWASPPCQELSSARTQGPAQGNYSKNHLAWCLELKKQYPHLKVLWVENIKSQKASENTWGTLWNAAQFAEKPLQNRQRVIGGEYPSPETFRDFKSHYPHLNLCPCVTATEFKGCASDKRRASRYFGRRMLLEEVAYHMGMPNTHGPCNGFRGLLNEDKSYWVPSGWEIKPEWFEGTNTAWRNAQYRGLGNGVPVWMAKAFGDAAKAVYG